jgi:hypothetical protein
MRDFTNLKPLIISIFEFPQNWAVFVSDADLRKVDKEHLSYLQYFL